MKQGRIATRIITFVVMACVVAYMGFQIADSAFNRIRTVSAALYCAEDSIPVNGYFVRDELLLENPNGGIADVSVAEGQRVGKRQPIALVYPDQAACDAKRQLDLLDDRISRLEAAQQENIGSADAEKLDQLIREQIYLIGRSADARDFTLLREQGAALKSLVFRREYAFTGSEELAAVLSSLKSERDAKAKACESTKSILSPESGVFTGAVDGYEQALSPGILADLTVKAFDGFASLRETVAPNRYLGKLVRGFDWYYVCAVPYARAKLYHKGDAVTLRFSKGFDGLFSMKVYSVGGNEDGQTVLALTSESFLSRVISLRRLSADIVCSRYEGIKIPREAIRIGESGVRGVYCLIGLQAKFKPVDIVYDSGTYCLAAYKPDEGDSLRPGDEIITAARNLYDGKVVK